MITCVGDNEDNDNDVKAVTQMERRVRRKTDNEDNNLDMQTKTTKIDDKSNEWKYGKMTQRTDKIRELHNEDKAYKEDTKNDISQSI